MHRPNVVITDIRMPPTNSDEGVQAAATLRESHPEIGVVVISQYVTPHYALKLFEHGSAGRAYLLKEHVGHRIQLMEAIREVAEGGSVVDPKVVDVLVEARMRARNSLLARLSTREREVLAGVATGASNAAIAESLFLTKRAVEKNINSLFAKLGLTDDKTTSRRVRAALLFLADSDLETETRRGARALTQAYWPHREVRAPWSGVRPDCERLVAMALTLAELDAGPIPDYAEPVEAWRVWRVSTRNGRVVLQSLFAGTVWEPAVALVASCTGGHRSLWAPWRKKPNDHPAPELDCRCGIYGVQSVAAARSYLETPPLLCRDDRVIGRVALWGDVVEGPVGLAGLARLSDRALRSLSGGRSERASPPRLRGRDHPGARGLRGSGRPRRAQRTDSLPGRAVVERARLPGPQDAYVHGRDDRRGELGERHGRRVVAQRRPPGRVRPPVDRDREVRLDQLERLDGAARDRDGRPVGAVPSRRRAGGPRRSAPERAIPSKRSVSPAK